MDDKTKQDEVSQKIEELEQRKKKILQGGPQVEGNLTRKKFYPEKKLQGYWKKHGKELQSIDEELTKLQKLKKQGKKELPKNKEKQDKTKDLALYWSKLQKGNKLKIGNNTIVIQKKNNKSIVTESGTKWTIDEIIGRKAANYYKEHKSKLREDAPEKTQKSDQTMKDVGNWRPDFLNGKILFGKKIELQVGKTKRTGQFVICELTDVIASHNPNSFKSNPEYPKNNAGRNLNDRNYETDKNAQNAVINYAQNLNPSLLINTSRTPESGTPIISVDGFCVSGNNRMMSIKRAKKNNPSKYSDYIVFLYDECDAFRIDCTLLKEYGIKNPVLVRIDYDFPEYKTSEISKYNKDLQKSKRPTDKAVELSVMLSENPSIIDKINKIVGKYERLSDFYESPKDISAIVKIFVDNEIWGDNELSEYVKESQFTDQGKEFFETILASIVLSADAIELAEITGVKKLRQVVAASLPVLLHNTALGENSLKAAINESFYLQHKISGGKISFVDYIRQASIYARKWHRKSLYVNRLMNAGQRKFKEAISKYNDAVVKNKDAGLFGDAPTSDEIFNHFIAAHTDDATAKIIETSPLVIKGAPEVAQEIKPSQSEEQKDKTKQQQSKNKEAEKKANKKQKEQIQAEEQNNKALADSVQMLLDAQNDKIKLGEQRLLDIALSINALRSEKSKNIDLRSSSKKTMKLTPSNILRWALNPGRYDLRGVDTKNYNVKPSVAAKKVKKEKVMRLLKK